MIVGAVNVLSTLVAVFGVDKLGRRILLLEAGVQMFIAEIIVAILLGCVGLCVPRCVVTFTETSIAGIAYIFKYQTDEN